MAVNEKAAYMFWAFGGIFGLHHFYLGRDIQAFVWFSTFGGGLIGWIKDYWRIQDYVNEANGGYIEERAGEPRAGWTLSFRQVFLGLLFSIIFRLALPVQIFIRIGPSWFFWYYYSTLGVVLLGSALGHRGP